MNLIFFEQIASDVLVYSQQGDIMLVGDLYSRVGERSDIIENINLDRYVHMPVNDVPLEIIPARSSCDSHVNQLGNTLLSLCKENSLLIVNGRLEQNRTEHNRNFITTCT